MPKSSVLERQTYNLTEAAQLLGLSRWSVHQRILKGEIYGIRLGSRVLVPRWAIDNLLTGKEHPNGTPHA